MARRKHRGSCRKYGRSKRTGRCRIRPSGGRRRRMKLGGRKVRGGFKVACNGKRVYASASESSARAAASAASKRMGRCLVFTKKGRVATYAHGQSA